MATEEVSPAPGDKIIALVDDRWCKAKIVRQQNEGIWQIEVEYDDAQVLRRWGSTVEIEHLGFEWAPGWDEETAGALRAAYALRTPGAPRTWEALIYAVSIPISANVAKAASKRRLGGRRRRRRRVVP